MDYLINSEERLATCIADLRQNFDEHKYMRINVRLGRDRTGDQNALSFAMYRELAKQDNQGDEDYYRSTCKLTIGIPILARNPKVAEKLAMLKQYGMTYEDKLALMIEPFDFPVTRLMTREEFSEYIDRIGQKWPNVDFESAKRVNGY